MREPRTPCSVTTAGRGPSHGACLCRYVQQQERFLDEMMRTPIADFERPMSSKTVRHGQVGPSQKAGRLARRRQNHS